MLPPVDVPTTSTGATELADRVGVLGRHLGHRHAAGQLRATVDEHEPAPVGSFCERPDPAARRPVAAGAGGRHEPRDDEDGVAGPGRRGREPPERAAFECHGAESASHPASRHPGCASPGRRGRCEHHRAPKDHPHRHRPRRARAAHRSRRRRDPAAGRRPRRRVHPPRRSRPHGARRRDEARRARAAAGLRLRVLPAGRRVEDQDVPARARAAAADRRHRLRPRDRADHMDGGDEGGRDPARRLPGLRSRGAHPGRRARPEADVRRAAGVRGRRDRCAGSATTRAGRPPRR